VKSETKNERRERQEARSQRSVASGQGPEESGQGDKSVSTMAYALCVLRHDVDLLPEFALNLAKLENELGICGTYYFRIIPETFNVEIIKKIAVLGHEIGYHYEDVDLALQRQKSPEGMASQKGKSKKPLNNGSASKQLNNAAVSGQGSEYSGWNSDKITSYPLPTIIDLAYELFKVNLEKMRSVTEIKTICMHGSPLSPYDNKLIWSKYGYRELGIVGEPYLDIDWNEFGYLTDTGRSWENGDISIRDRVESKFKFKFKTTKDIIDNVDLLPDKLMITVHPQRWTDAPLPWVKELIMQNMKNVVKRLLIKIKVPQ
jgi:hypothetical protein